MSNTPTSQPDQHHPGDSGGPRRQLHVVRSSDEDTALAAVDGELAGHDPFTDDEGNPVTPQAPWDVRIREALIGQASSVPRLGQAAPSLAEALDYSQHGDWAASSNGVKRAVHGLATVVTFAVTWLPVDVLGAARAKPGPFAIAVLLAIFTVATLLAL